MGPMPITSGATPREAKLTKRARGLRLKRLMAVSLARISAPAPSLVCELLPAVTLPLAANTGRNFANPSSDVSGRAPSSMFTVRVFTFTSPVAKLGKRSSTSTAVISLANSPAAMARKAF